MPLALDRLLVVAEPWASLLVDGEKTWELRTTSTKVPGPIGIAAKGTGTIIGAVERIDIHGPFTRPEIAPSRSWTSVSRPSNVQVCLGCWSAQRTLATAPRTLDHPVATQPNPSTAVGGPTRKMTLLHGQRGRDPRSDVAGAADDLDRFGLLREPCACAVGRLYLFDPV